MRSSALLCLALAIGTLYAQESAKVLDAPERARVFITDSQSWEMAASSGGSGGTFAGTAHGGARPQTAEIIKTFGERCPDVIVNNIQAKADYIVLLDHEGGKGYARKDNKVAVFDKDGDSIVSHSTRSLGNAVKDACEAITNNWPAKLAKAKSQQSAQSNAGSASVVAGSSPNRISVASTPPDADIEVDGNFVGNTPSDVQISEGEHVVSVKKTGYKEWTRKLKLTGGSNIHLSAELEKVANP